MLKNLITFICLALLTTTASAATARASIVLNVRAHPGTSHAVVDTLKAGERVTIIRCRNNWCHIRHRGPDGWVSANYLTHLSTKHHRYWNDPCDVDPSTAFHLRFGLAHSPLGRYCRERDD